MRKKWPDALEVQLQEYRPLAVWNGKRMLAEQGSMFAMPNAALPSLPRFAGQDAQAKEMLQFYEKTQPMFRSVGLGIRELSLSERRAWRVVLSDGLVLDMGRNDVAAAPVALHQPAAENPRATMRASWCMPICATPTASPWSGRKNHHGAGSHSAPTHAGTGRHMNRKSDKSLIVGLDIGTSKVTALVGEYSPDSTRSKSSAWARTIPTACVTAWWSTSNPPCSRSRARSKKPR